MLMSSTIHLQPVSRAVHIGSFLRPKALFEKRQQLESKQCTSSDLKSVEDAAIKHIVELQRNVGIQLISDGELRRSIFYEGVFNKLEGMIYMPDRPIDTFKRYIPRFALLYAAGLKSAETYFCNGKIKRTQSFYVDEFNYLKSLVPPEDVKFIKITICSPTWFHQRHGSDYTYDFSVYKNDNEYFDDLGVAYRAEVKELYELGCRNIQIDDPTLCYFCDEKVITGMNDAGVDHETLLDTYIRAINIVTQGRPHDLTIGIHMCRGNYTGGVHFSEGGYARIAFKIFNTLDVDIFNLEYDTERAGDFAPLKDLPLNKVVVLGLVTTKNPKLETIEELKARVNEAADVLVKGNPQRPLEVAMNQLCISTQCGFASAWRGNPVSEEDEIKKLTLLVAAAKEIWPETVSVS